jgi:hypothetical protein
MLRPEITHAINLFFLVFFAKRMQKTETKVTKARKKDLTASAKSLILLERETGFESSWTKNTFRAHN